MKKGKIIGIVIVGIILIIGFSTYNRFRSTYNNMIFLQEDVSSKWSQVENVYQRRSDLIPNLVATVKGYATHEEETFTKLAEARSQAGGNITVSDEVLNDPAMFERFQQTQANLGGALQRLLMVTENYPELKANESFLGLQSQLEGTENRITVERQRFNESAKEYNTYIKLFPNNIFANIFGFDDYPYFTAVAGAEVAPTVDFGN